MENIELILGTTLTATAAASVWFDVRERRLPNRLTVGALTAALLLRAVGGLPELGSGIAAAAIGFFLALPFFAVGGLGGGDVKLMAAVGGFLGLNSLPVALAVTALTGGVMAAVAALRRRALGRTLANLWMIVNEAGSKAASGWRQSGGSAGRATIHSAEAITIPYGVAIAVGGLAGWWVG